MVGKKKAPVRATKPSANKPARKPKALSASSAVMTIHRAVELGREDLVRALLDAGADPNAEDSAGMTPLDLAARRSIEVPAPLGIIDLLVLRGADVEGTGGATPLLRAAEDGQIEQAERLIAHGAKLDAVLPGAARKTALHLAFERGDDAMARLLVEHGADRTRRGPRGLDLATVYGAWGEDVRSLRVRYQPSTELQRLEIALTLCALHPAHIPHYARADFEAGAWAHLIRAGVAGGALFAPPSGTAVAVRSVDLRGITDVGVYERTLALDVACVAPEFIAMMARSLLAQSTTPTGAPAFAPLRVVALEIRGANTAGKGVPLLDEATARRWAREHVPVPGYATRPRDFAVEVIAAEDPSLTIVAARPPSAEDARTVLSHAQAWLAMQPTWRPTPLHDGTPVSLVSHGYSADAPSLPLLRLGKTGGLAKVFPYELASARATLHSAMQALSARVPLAEVVLAVPQIALAVPTVIFR